MNSNLLFDFTLDKANKCIRINREFNGDLELVWQTWTDPKLLDQWWAPKPYHIETKTLELNVGGMWLYAMVSPQNEKMWCRADYKNIETHKLLSWLDTFCDEHGKENNIKPRSLWNTTFTNSNGKTLVNIVMTHDKLEDVEAMVNMGFKEGFSMAVGNLDELLLKLKK